MKNHTTCPRCRGTGWIELTGVYAETLDLLRAQSDEVTAAALARPLGVRATTVSDRLDALEFMGFAVSRRFGRVRMFRAVKGDRLRAKAEVEEAE